MDFQEWSEESVSLGFGVIFDADGVLVDSEPISLEAFRRTYAELGVNVDEEDVEAAIGRTVESAVAMIQERYGVQMNVNEFWARRQRLYEELVNENGIDAFPGVQELLNELEEEGVPFALASSGRLEKIELNLLAAGLEGRFSTIISGSDVRQGKPAPEIFLLAAQRLFIPPEKCVVIEDSSVGVEAARRAGMPCIAVTNTFPGRVLSAATCVVSSLESVNIAVLKRTIESFASRPRERQ